MSSVYRVYVRFGESNCLRFLAPGNGMIEKDGLEIFEWVRNPSNTTRLRGGLRYVYEVDQKELRNFIETQLQGDQSDGDDQMGELAGGSDMLAALSQKHDQFNSLVTGVEKLEAISNATGITVIPRTFPRKRSDQPGWLYLLDLDQDTMEVYEFKDYKPNSLAPFSRLTIQSLYEESPDGPPGYYIKLKLSELEAMWRSEWITTHQTHAKALERLWTINSTILQTIPHADTIPFAVLYGSVVDTRDWDDTQPRRSTRLTQTRLTEVLAAFNRRRPSKVAVFERECQYDQSRAVVYKRQRLQDVQPAFELRREILLKRQQKRVHKPSG